jgi:hypothetical protein
LFARILIAAVAMLGSAPYPEDIVEPKAPVYFPSELDKTYTSPALPPDYASCGTLRYQTILMIAGYAERAGFEDENIAIAVAVSMAESDGRADARNSNRNGSTDSGLWQINSIHGFDNLKDPQANADAAFEVWRESGWTAWYAHTPRGGAYGSGMWFTYWHPIVECILTLAP